MSTRAIRRWHEIGLLPEPERRSNGYKRYDTTHLVRVLRIKRLSSLGFRLDRVGEMLDGAVPEGSTATHSTSELAELRSALDGRIAELERLRRDIDELIAVGGPPDVSPAALRVQAVLGEDQTSRDIAILLTQLTEEGYLAAVVERLAGIDEGLREIERELIGLAPTASDTEIADLSQRAAYRARAFLVATEQLAAPPRAAADSYPVDLLTDALLGPKNRAQRRVVGAVLDALADLA